MRPNYQKIYTDIVNMKYPEKMEDCERLLRKDQLNVQDIMEINKKIFGITDVKTETFNQRHKNYSKSDVVRILDYQKKNRLNNSQVALHFKLSRNTIAKWKRVFLTQD